MPPTGRAGGRSRFHTAYGASPLHLVGTLGALALTAYTISVLGVSALWNPDVWWQSIIVWFLGAVIAHDLVLFPLYALGDRLTHRGLRSTSTAPPRPSGASPLNYLRVPIIAVVLLFLLFFPGILQQGAGTYRNATGQTQDPFLERWLVLSAVIFALSAAAYALRLIRGSRSDASPTPAPEAPIPAADGSTPGHRPEHEANVGRGEPDGPLA